MVNPAVANEIHEQLNQLAPEQQRQVLDFVRALVIARGHGMPGQALLRFGGTIDANDLVMMAQAIEEGCEKVNPDDW